VRPRSLRPSRRDLLALLGTGALGALIPACGDDRASGGRAATSSRGRGRGRGRVGIVGGGTAGVMTAWLLDGVYDTVLFEAAPKLGGNAQTVEVDVRGQPAFIDVGPQYFHPGPYPRYSKLIDLLGLAEDVHAAPSSISIFAPGEPMPRFVSPILPDRAWPLSEQWNTAGVQAFAAMSQQAIDGEQQDHDWRETVDEFLARLPLTPDQRDEILLPWIASIAGVDLAITRGWSARAALVFLARATTNPVEIARYQTLRHGMNGVLGSLVNGCSTLTVRTASPVTRVTRDQSGKPSVTAGGVTETFDALVIAAPAHAAVRFLRDLRGAEALRTLLGQIEWTDARVVLHRDGVYAHADPKMQSFLNCDARASTCEGSMRLGDALAPMPDGQPVDVWKSWASFRDVEPAELLHSTDFRHVSITPSTHDAQVALRARSGQDGLWFAGGWTQDFDSQETCLASALAIADGLRALGSKHANALAAATG
jgi:predicted NAD/FAD-binding protein